MLSPFVLGRRPRGASGRRGGTRACHAADIRRPRGGVNRRGAIPTPARARLDFLARGSRAPGAIHGSDDPHVRGTRPGRFGEPPGRLVVATGGAPRSPWKTGPLPPEPLGRLTLSVAQGALGMGIDFPRAAPEAPPGATTSRPGGSRSGGPGNPTAPEPGRRGPGEERSGPLGGVFGYTPGTRAKRAPGCSSSQDEPHRGETCTHDVPNGLRE